MMDCPNHTKYLDQEAGKTKFKYCPECGGILAANESEHNAIILLELEKKINSIKLNNHLSIGVPRDIFMDRSPLYLYMVDIFRQLGIEYPSKTHGSEHGSEHGHLNIMLNGGSTRDSYMVNITKEVLQTIKNLNTKIIIWKIYYFDITGKFIYTGSSEYKYEPNYMIKFITPEQFEELFPMLKGKNYLNIDTKFINKSSYHHYNNPSLHDPNLYSFDRIFSRYREYISRKAEELELDRANDDVYWNAEYHGE